MAWKNPHVWELEFRAGTNYLATIRTCAGVFEVAGIEYRDGSETLLASWKKLQAQLDQFDADGNSKSYK